MPERNRQPGSGDGALPVGVVRGFGRELSNHASSARASMVAQDDVAATLRCPDLVPLSRNETTDKGPSVAFVEIRTVLPS